MSLEFEDILKSVGDFGYYQKLLIMILLPISIMNPLFFVGIVFMTSTPDHWCNVPVVASSNLSLVDQMTLIRPKKDSQCTMYDIDYKQLLQTGTLNSSNKEWPTKQCDKGWQYDRTNYDATASTRWNLVCNDSHYVALVLSLAFAGDVIGTPLFGHFTDKYGRKPIFFSLCAVTAIAEISSVFSPNFILFVLLRVVSGSGVSVLFANAYVTLLELVAISKRTSINILCTGSWSFGLCLLPLLAWLTRHWVRLSIVFTSFALSLFGFWRLFPESPRWLISHERYDEAKKTLSEISQRNGKTVHQSEELEMQIHMLGERVKKEEAKQPSLLQILKYSRIRRTFILINCCWIGTSLPYYGLLLNLKNLGGNEFLNFFYLSALAFPSYGLTWICMEKVGRRWTSVFAPLLTVVGCLVPVFLPPEMVTAQIVASLFGRFGAVSAYLVLYQVCPELYPTPFRTLGLSLSFSIGSSSSLCTPFIVDLARYGKQIPFLIFAASSFIASICASFLTETLDRALPQTLEDAQVFGKDDKFFSFNRPKPQGDNGNVNDSVTKFTGKSQNILSNRLSKRESEDGTPDCLSYGTLRDSNVSPHIMTSTNVHPTN